MIEENYKMFLEELQKAIQISNYNLNNEQLEQFNKLYNEIVEWNKKINLTAITDPSDFAIKHIIDSISIWNEEKFSNAKTFIDVGTGAGFPGIPLKIYKNDINITLLDSLNKRIQILQGITEKLALKNIFLIHSRAEDAAHNKNFRENFDIAVSRAVARLNILAEYCLPFVKVGGYFIALKGANVDDELSEAKKAIKLLGGDNIECVNFQLPNGDKRNIIYIKKVLNTSKNFPRKAGIPEKKPLI